MTIVNINLCLETSLSADEINNADDMAEVIIEALGLKDSPVYSCNVDVDIVEDETEAHAARNTKTLPSCYGKKLGCEACFGNCPVKDECYN